MQLFTQLFDIKTAVLDERPAVHHCKHNHVNTMLPCGADDYYADPHEGKCLDCGETVWDYGGTWSLCPF
jgi:hypothetical protein